MGQCQELINGMYDNILDERSADVSGIQNFDKFVNLGEIIFTICLTSWPYIMPQYVSLLDFTLFN